jgi:hypothetical protein
MSNRAERRRQERAMRKSEAVYNIKRSDLEYIHDEAIKSVARRVVPMVLYTSLMVLHDKYGFEKKRLGDFTESVFDLYEAIDQQFVSFDDLAKAIEEETGVVITGNGDPFHVDADKRKGA